MITDYSPFLGYNSNCRGAKEVAHVCAAIAAGRIGDLTYAACIATDAPISALDERARRRTLDYPAPDPRTATTETIVAWHAARAEG